MQLHVSYLDGTIKKLSFDERKEKISKLTDVARFRKLVSKLSGIPIDRVRLLFLGKELCDVHEEDGKFIKDNLHYYDIEFSLTLQVAEKAVIADANEKSKTAATNEAVENSNSVKLVPAVSLYYKTGEFVDAKNMDFGGAWLEARIVQISRETTVKSHPDSKLSSSESSCSNQPCTSSSSSNDEDSQTIPSSAHQTIPSSAHQTIPSSAHQTIPSSAHQTIPSSAHQTNPSSVSNIDDGLTYTVEFEKNNNRVYLSLSCIRPRARKKISVDDVVIGSNIMVNYNTDEPTKIGYYYDFLVTSKDDTRTKKFVIGSISLGDDDTQLHNCNISLVNHLYVIEKNFLIKARDYSQQRLMIIGPPEKRPTKALCDSCQDRLNVKCRVCSCYVCGGKAHANKQIQCDECENFFHTWCVKLASVPDEDEWFCPNCKNEDDIVKPGKENLSSKKKSKGKGPVNGPGIRDWGMGKACAGLSTECTIVGKNHFGPIPGVEVGMSWEYRVDAAGTGVHRSIVPGIHGRTDEGAFSIVFSGGYDGDKDEGESIVFTGSGGRDLSRNRRTSAVQSKDQELTYRNKALALNCAAPINCKKGATAEDWKSGKPIRVLRGFKGRKHSIYCPVKGYRYDGIYKVVKYWPEKCKSGFNVWRFRLQRDDPIPAPWTDEGKERMKALGIEVLAETKVLTQTKKRPVLKVKSSEKRKARESSKKSEDEESGFSETEFQVKKFKPVTYSPPMGIQVMIKEDNLNEKIWAECVTFCEKGEIEFRRKVIEQFTCPICYNFVKEPVTLSCAHTFCQGCIQRQLKLMQWECAHCRNVIPKTFNTDPNGVLREILKLLVR